jgi:hypothetical protein
MVPKCRPSLKRSSVRPKPKDHSTNNLIFRAALIKREDNLAGNISSLVAEVANGGCSIDDFVNRSRA